MLMEANFGNSRETRFSSGLRVQEPNIYTGLRVEAIIVLVFGRLR